MKQCYVPRSFAPETQRLVVFIDQLIEGYQAQGFVLSVRQLYYQLVARDMIENTERSYKRVASIINDARLAGMLDWDAIEDRGRDIEVRNRWRSGGEVIEACAQQFHMDMWAGQPHRVFVIVEKAALTGVLSGVCRTWDAPLLAARGYPSVSILRDLALQHIVPALRDDQEPVILHLGDHDPSGIDMTRDLDERLSLFIEAEAGVATQVKRIALTMPQIEDKKPPPNPAKTTDARFAGYLREFGDQSWELDALDPQYLVALVESQIEALVDPGAWEGRKYLISATKSRLAATARGFKE